MPPPPPSRRDGRNSDWRDLFNRDVLSMPDKWEYPWYASWDTAFHMICFARIDPEYAKRQLIVFLREWYMHPSGKMPAYEFNFSDVNPPVHAWACWRVYKIACPDGKRDRAFLASAFQKLLLDFTWWVNRKDPTGRNIFSGGFLGLDNIGLFDRSKPLPSGEYIQEADATAWMAFFCGTMLSMALELARDDPAYEDMASKFFEHYRLHRQRHQHARRQRAVGRDRRLLLRPDPVRAGDLAAEGAVARGPAAADRRGGHRAGDHRPAARLQEADAVVPEEPPRPGAFISYMESRRKDGSELHYLLAIPSLDRLKRMLRYLLDENEFLSPVRHPLAVQVPPGPPVLHVDGRRRASGRVLAR